ncbi:copper transporter [Kineococcus sp. SYSU DK006]|uniref:copper transporter n=1 Tax=Kineococcus sp. SYSU DK006 TaxID=3383127 RepID=UPI003D7E820C
MIDFRYHVVSLVSVFLALAVGIVLGAGPLNEGISTGITDQVRQLTQEKNQLRAERDQALATADAQDSWAEAVTPALVARQLGGRAIALVELPGADSSQVDAAVDVLQQAGASVPVQVTVQDAWTDSAQASTREQVAGRLSGDLASAPAADAGTEVVLAAELARGLVADDLAQADQPDPGAVAVLTALADAGLVEVEGGTDGLSGQRATLALVVGGAPDADATDAQTEGSDAAWVAIAAQLDATGAGAVLAGPPESAADGGPVAALRADADAAADVSTVDDLDASAGRVNAVLALRQQLSGEVGHYGTAGSATALNPPLPAAAP